MLYILPVTPKNREAVLALRVADSQKDYIETTEECLQEADALSLWRPVGIYDGETLVGFAMYGLWQEEGAGGRVWLDRLMIDCRYQGKGYGSGALNLLIPMLFEKYGCEELYLSIHEENKPAQKLYERFGFRLNGEVDPKGEKLLVLRRTDWGNGFFKKTVTLD